MTMPFSPNTTYVATTTPSIKAQDMDDLQTYLSAIYAASLSLKKMRLDGTGNQAVAPVSLLELKAIAGQTTPLLAALNSSGQIRWLIDHNGYVIGFGITQVYEPWIFAPTAGGSIWSTAYSTGASATRFASAGANYGTPYLQITPSSAGTATSYAMTYTPSLFSSTFTAMSMVLTFEMGLNAAAAGSTSNSSFIFGLGPGSDPFGADQNYAFLYKPHNGTGFVLKSNNGGGWNDVTSASPTANPLHIPIDRFKIEWSGSASPTATYQAQVYQNEASIGTIGTIAMPGTADERIIFGFANEGGAPSGGPLAYVGPIRLTWNYLLSPPAF